MRVKAPIMIFTTQALGSLVLEAETVPELGPGWKKLVQQIGERTVKLS